ncbi:MAG TPA: leucyl/phenylalanyl-tRNA--protein transferase [Bdellovibrionales bacterium]|nr:leucyl/phenylalanyl-tRNA--protein transferase [Bdellovibrionales bacterium]
MPERVHFPDPRYAGDDGLLCVGGDLRVETLVDAYSQGIFPWPQEGLPLLWFCPARRGVLDFKDLHWPRRFLQELKNKEYTITFDQAFTDVIRACAETPRRHEAGTWILPPMEAGYRRFHEAGYAHSVECWKNGQLVGGLYGVYVGGVFSGESMFHSVSGASKRCLYALTEKLKASGVEWMDIQMVTPVLETFGGKYISREDYLNRIQTSKKVSPRIEWRESNVTSR